MEDIKRLNEALLVIERYSDYLCRKAWGKTLIIWGIISPIGLVIYFNRQALSMSLNMEVTMFTFLTTTIILLTGLGMTIYIFMSASRLVKLKKEETVESAKESSIHGIVIGGIWFLAFALATLIPEPFSVISNVWAAGVAIIISFLLLKYFFHDAYPELLVVGLILLISSIPLIVLVMIDITLTRIVTVLISSISFLIGGFYSFKIATNMLSGND